MKLSTILNGALTIAGTLHPGIGAAIAAVNAFLPGDKQLPATATGQDVREAADTLSPEQRAEVLGMEIELSIAQEEGWTERYSAMCAGDGQSTRPRIALMMARLLCWATMLLVGVLAYGVYDSGLDSLKDASAGVIGLFGVLTAVPASILAKYFGELRREQNARLGVEPKPLLGGLFKR